MAYEVGRARLEPCGGTVELASHLEQNVLHLEIDNVKLVELPEWEKMKLLSVSIPV